MALKGQALRKLMLIATAFALSTVTACGSPTTASKNNQGAAKDTPAPAAPDTPAPADTPTPDAAPAKVGVEGFTFQNGLKVAVLSITQAAIDQYAAGGKPGDVLLKVAVRITNGTGTAFDTSLVQVKATAGADGTQLHTVFQDGIASFTGSVPSGRSRTAIIGFAVTPALAKAVTIEVQPGFDYASAFFDR